MRLKWRCGGRAGQVLPVVLVSAMLLSVCLYTFQFVASTDQMQVRRLRRGTQASALADIAADELYLTVRRLTAELETRRPPWFRRLLERIDRARPPAGTPPGGVLDVVQQEDLKDELTETTEAAREDGAGMQVVSAKLTAGPFRMVQPRVDPGLIYAEPAFGDAAKDRVAWDLRGPVDLDVVVRAPRGPFVFDQHYVRLQDLVLTDTTPPACEFALFSYRRPPDEDYALNDLQRGGRLTVYGMNAGRIHVRGPLVLLPEDASTGLPFLGGQTRPRDSVNYPDPAAAGTWTGWAAVPGPRALQHPYGALDNTLKVGLNWVSSCLGREPMFPGVGPARPTKPHSRSEITILGKTFAWDGVTVMLFAGLAAGAGIYCPLGDDQVASFPAAPYFYGQLNPGQQTLSLMGTTRRVPLEGGQSSSQTMFRGIHSKAGVDAPSAPFDPGGGLPEPGESSEGDSITIEPVPRESQAGARDAGILALYENANFERFTYWEVDIYDLAACFFSGGASTVLNKMLQAFGVKPSFKISFENYTVETLTACPALLTADYLETAIDGRDAVLMPYGVYLHQPRFWDLERMGKAFLDLVVERLIKLAVEKLTSEICGVMLTKNSGATIAQKAASAKLGQRLTAIDMRRTSDFFVRVLRPFTRKMLTWTGAKTQGEALRLFVRATAGSTLVKELIETPLELTKQFLTPRPNAFAPRLARRAGDASPDAAITPRSYPNGYYPWKYRDFRLLPTRVYPDMAAYLREESVDNILELRGAVLVKSLAYTGAPILYRGRGILVCETVDPKAPATLDAIVKPIEQPEPSHLILAHVVGENLLQSGKRPPLRLGRRFEGSVVSESGVAPAGDATLVAGNLVTGYLNKGGIDPALGGQEQGVHVVYSPALARAATGSRVPYWSVELIDRVRPDEPGK